MIALASEFAPHCEVVADARDREGWLAERRKMLTASDLASVLGLSPWKPAVEIYAQKHDPSKPPPDEVDQTEAMYLGTRLEPWLAMELEHETQCPVDGGRVLLRSKRWPWLGATLDREIVATGGPLLATLGKALRGARGAAELKASGAYAEKWSSPGPDGEPGIVPVIYRPQILGQLAVTGAPFSVMGALFGGRLAFRWAAIERDDEEIAELVGKCGQWWIDHVLADVPPMPDGSERASQVIASLYPELGGRIVLGDATLADVQIALRAKRQAKALAKEAAEAEQRIKMALGSATAATLPDGTEVSWPTRTRRAPVTDREERLEATVRAMLKRECPAKVARAALEFSPATTFRQLSLPKGGE